MWETGLTQLPYYCSRSHQMRLIKWDLKYRRLDGEAGAFLKELLFIHKGIYEASRGGDEGIRLAEADRLDAELAALMGRRWEDKDGNIERYRKRYRRESRFLTVCLRVPGVPPDNNPVERSNGKVVVARSDGEGNRSGAAQICQQKSGIVLRESMILAMAPCHF